MDLRDLGGDEGAEVRVDSVLPAAREGPPRTASAGCADSAACAPAGGPWSPGLPGLAHLLPQLEPGEASDLHILAGLGDRFSDQLADGPCPGRGTAARGARPRRTTSSAGRRRSGPGWPRACFDDGRDGEQLGPLGLELLGRDRRRSWCRAVAGRRPGSARSRTSFWNSSVRATKSVSQLTSISTPILPPGWM